MELRKVIKFGRATYSITLPKNWITQHKIKKGDILRVNQLVTGNLEIKPGGEEKEEVKSIVIKADGKKAIDIYREVVAAYVKNYTVINILGDVKGKIKKLRDLLQELMGLEIMEVNQDKIIAKSFLDITQTRVDHCIKRIFYLIKNMGSYFGKTAREGDKENPSDIEEILEINREVKRNCFFAMKYLFKCMENQELATKTGMKTYDILLTWELMHTLEKIANTIKEMSRLAKASKETFGDENLEKFMTTGEKIGETFNLVMEAYFKKSKTNIHTLFDIIENNHKDCEEMMKKYKSSSVSILIDTLLRSNRLVKNIAEIIVDFE